MAEGKGLRIRCPHCTKRWRVLTSVTGVVSRCPACDTVIDLRKVLSRGTKASDEMKGRLGSCGKCGEKFWELVSLSPSGKASSWRCGYCGKKEVIRNTDTISDTPSQTQQKRQGIPKAGPRNSSSPAIMSRAASSSPPSSASSAPSSPPISDRRSAGIRRAKALASWALSSAP